MTQNVPCRSADGAWQYDVTCYYYDPIKLPLIRDALLPIAGELRRRGLEVTPDRHWLHGPHVRLRLRGGLEQEVSSGADLALRRLFDWVTAHPSTFQMSEADLRELSESAGMSELILPPYDPFYPDNTVRGEDPGQQGLAELLGSEGALRCHNRILGEGMAALEESAAFLTDRGANNGARVMVTLTAMAAHAGSYPLGIEHGYQSFLSHVEEFLHFYDPVGRVRARFEAEWRRLAGQVCGVVERVGFAGDSAEPLDRAWMQWSTRAQDDAGRAYADGQITPVPGSAYSKRAEVIGRPDIVQQWIPARRTEYSEFHKARRGLELSGLPWAREFAAYRFTTNLLYNLLNLLDVSPIERYLAAYLHGEAVQRITGVSWQELVAGYAARQRSAGSVSD